MAASAQLLMIDSQNRDDLVTLLGMVRSRLMAIGSRPESSRGGKASFSMQDMERLIGRMTSVSGLRAMEKALEQEIGG